MFVNVAAVDSETEKPAVTDGDCAFVTLVDPIRVPTRLAVVLW